MNFVTVLFFLGLLLTIVASVGLLRLTGKKAPQEQRLWPLAQKPAADEMAETEKDTENAEDAAPEQAAPKAPAAGKKRLSVPNLIVLAVSAMLVVLGLGDLFGIADYGQFEGAFLLMGIAAVLQYAACLLYQCRKSRTVRFFSKLLLVMTVLELTVFQYPSYHLMLGDYPEKILLPSDATVESGDYTLDENLHTLTITGKNECVITFNDLNVPIGTVRAVAKLGKDTKQSQMVLDMADATHVDYRFDIAKQALVKDRENTQYIACEFSGDVSKLRLKFTGKNDGDGVVLQSLQLNAPIPFAVSPLRMALVLVLGTLAYAVACSTTLKRPYLETKKLCRRTITVMTAAVMAVAVLIVMAKLPDGGFAGQFKLDSGNQITQEQVDAFENGQISLLKEVDDALLQVENPYDWGMRNDSGAKAEWDHVFYDGKYYSYYGIAPVVLLYLPYHKLTGHYCSTNLSILLFSLVGLLFLAMAYLAFVKRWCKNVSAGNIIAGMAILFSSCGIWYSVGRTLFYEISISSGFAFVALGAYFLFSSNVLSEGKVSLVRTALASLFLGIAVLCRPTLAVYAVVAVLYFLYAIPKSGNVLVQAEDGTSSLAVRKPRRIAYVLCAALPLLALGITQMVYNYARFGSPLDFGIQYSLTINDFTHSQYHTSFVLIGLWNYLFAAPQFLPEYPYISTPFSKLDTNGFYFNDDGNTSGILFLAIPVAAYLLARAALRRLPDTKTRWKYGVMVGLPCVVMPLVIICSIWESGYAVRYTADFSWEILLGALTILFFLYQKSRNETKKDLTRKFMAAAMLCAVVVNGVQIFKFAFPQEQYPAICDHLTQLIAFWK